MHGRIVLDRRQFSEKPSLVAEIGGLRAYAFQYSTGVEAVRIESKRGEIVVLPYQGQQIWDARFEGRRLTMKNFFPEPRRSGALLDSYGAFLYHCGARRTGNPGPEDDHEIHGELPAAPYEEAWLAFGEEAGVAYLGISGSWTYAKAFGDRYRAVPLVKLVEGDTLLDVSMTVENLTHYPMDLMYMCHINFLPADGGEIVQPTGWTANDMVIRSQIPSHVKPTPEYLSFLDRLKADPGLTRTMRKSEEYNPEIVYYLKNLKRDAAGMTHVIQKHPDGSADYVSYDPEQLNHTVRWLLKHKEQEVIGMALPATCDPEGYTAEKNKGNVRTLAPHASVTFRVKTGYLDERRAKETERMIREL